MSYMSPSSSYILKTVSYTTFYIVSYKLCKNTLLSNRRRKKLLANLISLGVLVVVICIVDQKVQFLVLKMAHTISTKTQSLVKKLSTKFGKKSISEGAEIVQKSPIPMRQILIGVFVVSSIAAVSIFSDFDFTIKESLKFKLDVEDNIPIEEPIQPASGLKTFLLNMTLTCFYRFLIYWLMGQNVVDVTINEPFRPLFGPITLDEFWVDNPWHVFEVD